MPVRFVGEETGDELQTSEQQASSRVRFQEDADAGSGSPEARLRRELNFGYLQCGNTYASHLPAHRLEKDDDSATRDTAKVEAKIIEGDSIAEIAAGWIPGKEGGTQTLEIIVHAKDDVHGKFSGIVQGKLHETDEEEFIVDVCGQTMRSNKGTPMLRDHVTCIGRCTKEQTDSDYF
jgi:hypothetical protein